MTNAAKKSVHHQPNSVLSRQPDEYRARQYAIDLRQTNMLKEIPNLSVF
jgi:hypothetical protein